MKRRRDVCEAYSWDPLMKALYELLIQLPHTICSGDETVHEGGKLRYAITSTEWRAPVLRFVFRILDRLHLSTRFTADHRATRGAFPHIRVPSNRKDYRGPPGMLPANMVDFVYLNRLEQHEKARLMLQAEATISFSPAMLRYVLDLPTVFSSLLM